MIRWRTAPLVVAASLILLSACSDQPEPLKPVTPLSLETDCEVLEGCRVDDSDVSMEILFETRPRALQPFPLRVKAETVGPLERVTVGFTMRGMDMGRNRYALQQGANGEWTGSITLPVCVSGRSDWVAGFELQTADKSYRVDVPFVLSK